MRVNIYAASYSWTFTREEFEKKYAKKLRAFKYDSKNGTIELATMEDLMALAKEVGELIIDDPAGDSNSIPCVGIYDDWEE